jgi:hypothetical protein
MKRLRLSKSVILDDIPSFDIEDCSEMFIPVRIHIHKFIFNLSLSQNTFLNLLKQVFFKGKTSSVGNYMRIAILNNRSIVLTLYLVFFYSRSNVTNLVPFLDFLTLVICSQGQTDSIYFYFSKVSYILPHVVLHKLNNYGLFSGYFSVI